MWLIGPSSSQVLLLSGSEDATVRAWDAGSGSPGVPGTCTAVMAGHTSWVTCLALAGERAARVAVSGAGDGTFRVWALRDYGCRAVVPAHPGGWVTGLAPSATGAQAASVALSICVSLCVSVRLCACLCLCLSLPLSELRGFS